MFYRKKIFAWEQALRIVIGLAMIGWGVFYLSGWWAAIRIALGVVVIGTGVFGYCPACALIGRRPVDRA